MSFTKVLRLSLLLLGGLLGCSAALAQEDPPARVARLNLFAGNVSFAPAGSSEWAYATLNRPLTTGDKLWVDQGGRAELHAGSLALRASAQTSLEFLALDDEVLQVKLDQGSLDVRVRQLGRGQSVEIDTPNLAFVVQAEGDYRIDVAPQRDTTRVLVRYGEGKVVGADDNALILDGRQQLRFTGTDLSQLETRNPPAADAFDDWVAQRNAREDNASSVRYVSREVIGYEDLDDYGSWREVPEYGAVWFPSRVEANWAPYRNGHWVWIAPWGWTWVDAAPWGFAPFHYGRWAWYQQRWCWVPGPQMRHPIYAPALVAFASGGHGGTRWGVALNAGGPGVAWLPLAPGEAYRPVYRSSTTYVTNINQSIHIDTRYNHQHTPGAVTAMPAEAFLQGRPVPSGRVPLTPGALNHAQLGAAPVLAPVGRSFMGDSRPAPVMPPAFESGRSVIGTRAPALPPAQTDSLARRNFEAGGTVRGAGSLPERLMRPVPVNAAPVTLVAPAQHSMPAASREEPRNQPSPERDQPRGTPTRPNEDRGFEQRGQPGIRDGARPVPPTPAGAMANPSAQRDDMPRQDERRHILGAPSQPTSPSLPTPQRLQPPANPVDAPRIPIHRDEPMQREERHAPLNMPAMPQATLPVRPPTPENSNRNDIGNQRAIEMPRQVIPAPRAAEPGRSQPDGKREQDKERTPRPDERRTIDRPLLRN